MSCSLLPQRTSRILVVILAAQLISIIEGEDICEKHCNNHRPSGNDGPYVLNCREASGNQVQCGLYCGHCSGICPNNNGFFPESNQFNCPAKPKDSSSSFGSNGFGSLAIIITVVVLGCCCCCGGVAACVMCCRNSNNRRYPIAPVQPSATGYYGGTPSMMTMGGVGGTYGGPMQYYNNQYPYPSNNAPALISGPVAATVVVGSTSSGDDSV